MKYDNSCLTCALASNDNRCNCYFDLMCNIGYELGWDKVPFKERYNSIISYDDCDEIEAKYPCKYHITAKEHVERIDWINSE